MTKQNRALRAIDKNSLPKVLDVLEVSRAKQSKASNEPPKAERSDGNGRSFSIPSRKGWDKPMALSKTPKMSNLGGNRNVTTRRGRASNMRPPKPNAINSARRNRKSLGSSILTPYGAQMARLQNRKTIEKAFTPSLSKSPNLLRHYNRLKPITCRLYNQHSKQHQELEHSRSLTGNSQERVSSKQKTTINSTPSLTRTTNANTMKPPIAPLKGRSATSETSRQGNITEYETDNHNENENENSSDDMNCDSSDELSLNSSSSSSHSSLPQKSTYASSRKSSSQDGLIAPFSKANNGSTSQTGEEHQCTKKSLHSESNLKLSSERDDTRNIDSQKFVSSLIVATDQTDADVTEGTKNASASATTTIEDQEVFNLVMGCNSKEIDTDLLGSTIGDCRFSRNNVDEDSVLTTCSSVRAQKSATASKEKAEQVEREVFRTPLYASRDPGSSPLVSNEQNNQKKIAQKIHNQSNEYLEEESVEAWSIHGHRSSPFFFEIGGKKYGHPALPPGWTMRISSGENLPVYTHPDHGRTWHCPIKLTPNMMYAKTSSGKFVKQIKSSLSESAPKLYLESSTEDVLMPRSARGARPTPQTPPSIRDERSCEKERKQSVSQLKGTVVVDHLPPEQEDEDSTSELLKDISRLSAGLIKNSSSNLEKAEKVKTLHKKTQNLTKDVLSAEKQLGLKQQNQRLLSPQDLKPQTLSTMTSLLHQNDQTSTFETRRPRTKKLDFNESASPQDHEVETPSTMSAVLRQYEQTLACGHSVTTFSESQADDSRKQGVANRNLSKSFTHESARKQLSPIRESMGRSNVADGIKNMKSDRRGEWDMFSNISTKKKDKSKESIHRLSSETSFHNYGTSLLRRAAMSESEKKAMNQPRRIMPSNLNSFTKPANGDTKSTPNLLQLQKSKNTEHVEAWFTPTVQIEKVSGSAKDNISNCNFKDDTVLRFGVRKKKGSRSRLLSTEKIAQNEGLQTTTSFETNPYPSTLKGSSRPVKHPSTLYHDEWSPLAQLHSAGDKMHPKQKGSYESMPDSPVGVGYKPTGAVHIQENPCTLTLPLKEAESLNCNKNTNRSCGIPREIHRKSQSSSENENSKDGASIDSGLQSTQIMEDQCSLKVQKTNDTIHAVQETKDLLQPEEKYDATSEPKNKNVKCVDTVPNLESFEIAVNGSSDALSTKSDSDLSSNVDNHEQASETNNNEVISVTIAVHAHSTKKIRSSTIDVFDAARLDRPGQFDNSESFASIDVERPYAYDKSGNSRDIVAREDTPSRHDVKPNDVTGSGIKSDVYDDNESTLSQESYHSSEIAYTNTGHDGDTTNVCTMEDTEEDITAQSPLESADEKAISEFGTSCELCTTKGKSIAHNSENADDGCTYSSDTYNEAGSGNGSFTFADDMSDGFENSRIQANVQPSVFRANNGNVQGTTSSAEECFSPLKEDLDNNIDGAGSETESSIESPVQPTTFEKCDSYRSPQIEERNSSIESPVHLTADDSYCSPEIEDSNNTKRSIRGYRTISSTPRKQNRMSWRVLNPPHPICSLQHLEELILQNKRKELQAKQPKGGRQTKRKKYSAKRRRKSKSRGRY
jgi:hypothetical protein